MDAARPRRHSRHMVRARARRILAGRWRRRVLFLAGGLAVGGCAVLMALLADRAQGAFAALDRRWPWSPWLVTPLGFAALAWLTRRYAPAAAGSGIPQVIAARHHEDVEARARLVAPRVAVAKVAMLLLGLLCGASAGREGPTVQVGASVMFALGRLQPHRQRGLLLAGSAAGVAAAFNAPLAGIIFGIEEMSRAFEARTSGLVLSTVIAAGLTALATLGNYTYFGVTTVGMPVGPALWAVPLVGVVGGLAGGAFSRALIVAARGLPGPAGRWLKAHPVALAFACGLVIVLCATVGGASVFGTGYGEAEAILRGAPGSTPASWLYAPLKLVATAASTISGIPGGIFSPSLSVGAGLGRDLAAIAPGAPVEALAVLGMAAYLSGVVQAPITAFAIVVEMTEDHALLIPIMVAVLVAQAASRLVCQHGLYHALARGYA